MGHVYKADAAETRSELVKRSKGVVDGSEVNLLLVCLIFFCSWKMPYNSASLVGGHPGT